MTDKLLRQRLLEVTLNPSVVDHPALIEQLRGGFGHSIKVVRSEHAIERYTCGVHAFCLVEDLTYVKVAKFGLGRTYAGPAFINFLLQRGSLESTNQSDIVPGDLIMYFENGVFRHVGRLVTTSRVLSKWGVGHLYEHGIWEVPGTYGDEVRFFKGPCIEACLDLFIAYAESEDFTFRP